MIFKTVLKISPAYSTGKAAIFKCIMFYEHVSRQSTVDTSKHRRERDFLLQQISFSFHHMSSPVVDFGHAVVHPSLLSWASFSSLLSLPLCTCTPQSTHLWALQSKLQTFSSAPLGNPRAFSAPQAPGTPEKPGKTYQGDHAHMQIFL